MYVILQILYLKIIILCFFSCYSFAYSQFKIFRRIQSYCGTCTDDPHALLINSITGMPCINGFLIFSPFLNLFAYFSIAL